MNDIEKYDVLNTTDLSSEANTERTDTPSDITIKFKLLQGTEKQATITQNEFKTMSVK